MSYPKQPGQDAEAHRNLAGRLIAVVRERNALLSDLNDSCEELRDHALTVMDWPADAVLGESGVEAIDAVVSAYHRMSTRLANYPDLADRVAQHKEHQRQRYDELKARKRADTP